MVDIPNLTAEASAVIRRPVAEVFIFADTEANEPLWMPYNQESQQVSGGPVHEGTKGQGKGRFLGRPIQATWAVTEHVPNARVAYTRNHGSFLMHGLWLFEETPDGTWVRMSYRFEGDWRPVLGRLSNRALLAVWGKQLQGALRNLKHLLEV